MKMWCLYYSNRVYSAVSRELYHHVMREEDYTCSSCSRDLDTIWWFYYITKTDHYPIL